MSNTSAMSAVSMVRNQTRICTVGHAPRARLPRGSGGVHPVKIGGGNHIVLQTMAKQKTFEGLLKEIRSAEKCGAEMIRLAVPSATAAKILGRLKEKVTIPLVADIHFDPLLALAALENGADKIRINPGNFLDEKMLEKVLAAAARSGAAIRIGVNAGSLEKDLWEKYGAPNADALAESAKRWTNKVEKFGFQNFVVSLKSSRAAVMIEAYKKFAAMCPHVPLHLGVTEAGPGISGAVKCAVGIGSLLSLGIGNTIRVSTSGPIEEEIRIGKEILKSLGLYSLEPDLISCPGCGRAEVDINKLAKEVQKIICGINKPLRIAVMGCAVNALGEAREADFAIAGGKKCGALFMNGKLYASAVPEKELLKEFRKMLEENI